METVLFWPAFVLDALAILVSAVAVAVHAAMWHAAVLTLRVSKDADFVIPAVKFKRWLRINTAMAVLVGLNAVRWFMLNDMTKLRGQPVAPASITDNLIWVSCDLLLVVMPIILIGHMHAMARGKDDARG